MLMMCGIGSGADNSSPDYLSSDRYSATVEPDFNEQKAFQHLNLISRDFNSHGSREQPYIITCLINNGSEHSPYQYE